MDYIKTNKEAWEEAFEKRKTGWGDDNAQRLQEERLPFLHPDIVKELEQFDWTGKRVGQFCCNNGRELLSLTQLGIASGVGFDLADNILKQARQTAEEAGISNCQFVGGNVLETTEAYHNAFDLVFFTIGAITWFRELPLLFTQVSKCLRPGGMLLIHDFHPVMNMLPLDEEEGFDPQRANRMVFSYFKKEPWVEAGGMNYMSGSYLSKTFTSFSHTLGDIVTAAAQAGMPVTKLLEFDYDVGLTELYDGNGWPLSFLLTARKL